MVMALFNNWNGCSDGENSWVDASGIGSGFGDGLGRGNGRGDDNGSGMGGGRGTWSEHNKHIDWE